MSGMAQFLDFDMDSDEDFEESAQQGKFKSLSKITPVQSMCDSHNNFASNFHFGPEKYNTMAKITFLFIKW
jgi:hypothetical protein